MSGKGRTLVITPHPGEMARLVGCSIADVQKDRLSVARTFAHDHDLIVVLKGHRTLVVQPDGEAWVNTTGNPGMSTGGTGDILTGMVAAMIAQNPQTIDVGRVCGCATCTVWRATSCLTLSANTRMVATDLLRGIPGPSRRETIAQRRISYAGSAEPPPANCAAYLETGRRIVLPSAAERRAASRISVTVTFVSRDESPSSFAPSIITARR